jgi:DMSO/TMAO reductase YedYZ molybdopterin-dependent catalytic subunit
MRLTVARVVQRYAWLLVIAVALTVACSGVGPSTGTALAQAGETVELSGLVASSGPVSVDNLQQQFSAETTEVSYDSPQGHETHTFTGVRLFDVLDAAGLPVDPSSDDSPFVHMYVVLSARDGYQVVLSMGELAPDLGGAPILLAWERDGAPLPAAEGPLQLVVPGDKRVDRYIWSIETIDVRSVEEAAA